MKKVNKILLKILFCVKYLIPFRKLQITIECKEDDFLKIMENEIYNENTEFIKKDKYDFAFLGSIDLNKKTLKIIRNTLLSTWRSDASFTGKYAENEGNIVLSIKMRYTLKTLFYYILFAVLIMFFVKLPVYDFFLASFFLYFIFINYYFQEDAFVIKRRFFRIFKEKNILVNVKEKIW